MGLAIKMGATTPIVVETVLWENPDPTKSFSAQNVPVLQSVRDFDKLRIYWYGYTTLGTGPGYLELDKSQYDLFSYATDVPGLRFTISWKNSSNDSYYRISGIEGDTVHFGTCKKYNTTTTSDTNCIPYRVTGLSKKEIIIPAKGNELVTVLWTNPTPNSAMASGAGITLSDGLENYDLVRFLFKPQASSGVDTTMWNDYYIGKDPAARDNIAENAGIVISAYSGGTSSYIRSFYTDQTAPPFNTWKVSNGSRAANTTTNTSYVIPLVICGVNIDKSATERISKDIEVATTDWSSETVIFAGENCYYADYSITDYDNHTPVINITSSTETIPIDTQNAYATWKHATVDTTNMALRLYSTTVPEADFEIHVEGVA